MNWYLDVLKTKYAQFNGRAHREEFWMFTLINLGISVAVAVVAGILHIGFLSALYGLAVLVPSLAVGVRRLHDTNKSGWWLLIGIVPVVGIIVLIVFYAQEGEPGENQYGPSPKTVA